MKDRDVKKLDDRDIDRDVKKFDEPDVKKLARLVRKYGREFVANAAKTISVRGPGRPEDFEAPEHKSNVAWCIDTWAEEYRLAGSRTPIKDAEQALYDVMFCGDEVQRQEGHYDRWQKLFKKKRLKGRPYVQAEREAADRRQAWLKARKGKANNDLQESHEPITNADFREIVRQLPKPARRKYSSTNKKRPGR
jgi:hypothetical protein